MNENNEDKLSTASFHITENDRKKISNWIDIDNKIFIRNKELKALKDEKLKYEKDIVEFMQKSKISAFNSDNGYSVKLDMTKTKSSINENIIRDSLSEFVDIEKINDIMTLINSKRKNNEKKYLKKSNR